MKITSLAILLLTTLLLTACQSGSQTTTSASGSTVNVEGGSYQDITPDQLHAMLANKDFTMVNVHVPFEGNIDPTDLSIPYDQITEPANLALLPADKAAPIVLYCRSGRMSAIAAEALVKLGYTYLSNLKGGMVAWEQAGYPIQR